MEIPRIPPKPDVVALTGGYRRTPVMQIGADVYCDSLGIIQELERRYTDISLLDKEHGVMQWGLSRWTDSELFEHAIRIVLGSQIDALDEDFLKDRARLYFGPNWTKASIAEGVEFSLTQMRSSLNWMNESLRQNGPYLNGQKPTVADAFCYYICWFVRGRYAQGPAMLDNFECLPDWEKRIESAGHGHHENLESSQALQIANDATPTSLEGMNPLSEAEGLLGKKVAVVPANDGGDPEVSGVLKLLSNDKLVLQRTHERVGIVNVHFPVTGYRFSISS